MFNFVIMKKKSHKVFSVLMALVVLITTMSFTVDAHFCGESLIDFNFFSSAQKCEKELNPEFSTCENSLISENSCCTNQKIIKEASDELKISLYNFTLEQQFFVAVLFSTYFNFFDNSKDPSKSFDDYAPPFICLLYTSPSPRD